jgi:4a-hydroxytetrahydrobiopterin dehydratase
VTTAGIWNDTGRALEREFRFERFADAIAFVNRVAELAERENHHPDVDLRYTRVVVRWWTHTAGGVTDKDRRLSELTDALA